MMESWDWGLSANEQMVVRTIFLDERSSHLLFVAGQTLSRGEIAPLGRFVRRAVAHGATARAVVRLLGETVQSIARGADDRAEKVDKGLIIYLLSRKALLRAEETGMILTP
jgi:O-succinylbenzoate synthase